MADYLIDGLPVPAPSGLRRTLLPAGSWDRAAGGRLVLERACFKQRLELSWRCLPPEQEEALRAALTREAFFTLTVPGGYGRETEETQSCLLSYESSHGPSPAGPPQTAETVKAELLEK